MDIRGVQNANTQWDEAINYAKANMPDAKTGKRYKFIPLTLLDGRYRKMSGITVLAPNEPYHDPRTKQVLYTFEQRAGQADFIRNHAGVMSYDMFDCEHNRDFVASHYGKERFWVINDATIEREIQARRKKLIANSEKPVVDWEIAEWHKSMISTADAKEKKELEGMIIRKVGEIQEGKTKPVANKPIEIEEIKAEKPEPARVG